MCVEEIGEKYVSCELELNDFRKSQELSPGEKETKRVYILLEAIYQKIENIQAGDILIVGQEDGNVYNIYCKDNIEKNRRIELRAARRAERLAMSKIKNQ